MEASETGRVKPTEMASLVRYQCAPGTNKPQPRYTDGQIQHLKPWIN